ncbi:hypothetical protein LOTGIDRAFT_187340 [Lottia gigantea]|uniref:Dehydrogenase/reductase SDR family member 1 n=1 Tax=Lottia gigantea TaxID=225164 RepID=V4AXE3_LOTGI|nr:hypothetical protein LOTGIDRAFT_187340 [Lottia gigantea]ESO98241.1 hypothetical protein LOTGIDRAFT_187340 [Lottia gigantea]
MKNLSGKICLVTGATRGLGKGIALQLGEAGATVYITGRTLNPPNDKVGGSLKETAKEVERRGGKCIPVQCDHNNAEEIRTLFEKIKIEQDGTLDILVNCAFSAVKTSLDNLYTDFWKLEPKLWDDVNSVGLRNHYFCSVYAARMMVERKSGIIFNISSVGGIAKIFNIPYCAGKTALDRIVVDGAPELEPHNVSFISIYPCAVKTEVCKNLFQEKTVSEDLFAQNESTEFTGKCIVTLASDPCILEKTGRVLFSADIGDEYDLKDIDGRHITSQLWMPALLTYNGVPEWLVNWMPTWVKLPKWLLAINKPLYKF